MAAFADPDAAFKKLSALTVIAGHKEMAAFQFRAENRFLNRLASERFGLGPGERVPDWAYSFFSAYLCYGMRFDGSDRLIDRLIAERQGRLDYPAAAALLACQRSWASLLEVERVEERRGMAVFDLLAGESLYLNEELGNKVFAPGDLFFPWIGPRTGGLGLISIGMDVPRVLIHDMKSELTAALPDLRQRFPGVSDRNLGGELAPVVFRVMAAAQAGKLRPKEWLEGSDALELFCTVFDLADGPVSLALLASSQKLDAVAGGFAWRQRGAGPVPVDSRCLGHILIRDGRLVLATLTNENLDQGRDLLVDLLGERIRQRARSASWLDDVLTRFETEPDQVAVPLAPGLTRKHVGQLLVQYLADWLGRPQVMLGGLSPRDAAKSAQAREALEASIRDIEEAVRRLMCADRIDLAWIRDSLGLTR